MQSAPENVNGNPKIPPPPADTFTHPLLRHLHAETKFFLYHLTPSERPDKIWGKKPMYEKVADLITAGEAQYRLSQAGAAELLPFPIGHGDYFYDLGRHRNLDTKRLTDKGAELIRGYKARLLSGHSLGYYFTEDGHRFFFDLDGCRNPETGELTAFAQKMLDQFTRIGAYIEVSPSGTGLHIVGMYRGSRPLHGTDNKQHNLELYTADRGMAIGTAFAGTGSPDADCTETLAELIATYFQPKTDSERGKRPWTNEPEEDFKGPRDYQGVLELFLRGRKDKTPTNKQLYHGDQDAIAAWKPEPGRADGVTFDPTASDMLMARETNFYGGNNFELTLQLMESSPYAELRQDKWKSNVLRRETIAKAYSEEVYNPNYAANKAGFGQRASDAGRALTVPDGTANELTPEDFWAHLPSHKYINRYTREMYSVDAINGHLKRFTNGMCQGMKPAIWLDIYRAVHQMSWNPGYSEILEGMRSDNGELKPEPTGRIFNRYREPDAVGSDADASLWVNHINKIYPTDAHYIIQWFAYRVQNPGKKINHALVLGSIQGTGKDWMLKPLRYALGPANVATVKPAELFSQFNDWVESTLLIINEARDMGDESRYSFYETTKPLIAGPPDTLRCNLKGLTPYSVPNIMSVVITTNNKLSGLYLPPDDRRHYVTWSPAERPSKEYFDHLWDWMDKRGGQQAVVGYLKRIDVSGFGAQADPPKTEAWHQVVAASINPDELSLSDAIEGIQIATVKEIINTLQLKGYGELADSLRRSPRKIPHILETAGFEVLPNPHSKNDGRWRLIDGKRETIYVDRRLPLSQRLELANAKSRAAN